MSARHLVICAAVTGPDYKLNPAPASISVQIVKFEAGFYIIRDSITLTALVDVVKGDDGYWTAIPLAGAYMPLGTGMRDAARWNVPEELIEKTYGCSTRADAIDAGVATLWRHRATILMRDGLVTDAVTQRLDAKPALV